MTKNGKIRYFTHVGNKDALDKFFLSLYNIDVK